MSVDSLYLIGIKCPYIFTFLSHHYKAKHVRVEVVLHLNRDFLMKSTVGKPMQFIVKLLKAILVKFSS